MCGPSALWECCSYSGAGRHRLKGCHSGTVFHEGSRGAAPLHGVTCATRSNTRFRRVNSHARVETIQTVVMVIGHRQLAAVVARLGYDGLVLLFRERVRLGFRQVGAAGENSRDQILSEGETLRGTDCMQDEQTRDLRPRRDEALRKTSGNRLKLPKP